MPMQRKTKRLLAIFIPIFAAAAVLSLAFLMPKTYSAEVNTNITVPNANSISVYVSGMNVEKTDSGYYAPKGDTVTITAINESKLFASMTINGTVYTDPIVSMNVPEGGISVTDITCTEPFAENKGEYFGNPYLLSGEEEILALSHILNGDGTEAEFELFGLKNTPADIGKLQYGYYRIKTNLFVVDESFGGIGSRKYPFRGCMDFAGSNVSINITRTRHNDSDFHYDAAQNANIANFGFFSYICGDGVKPCFLRNIDVRGTIAINTMEGSTAGTTPDRINAGGIAGTAGHSILFDNISSQVSVSTQLGKATLCIGGLFGYLSSPIDVWCNAAYEGYHNDISGVTYGTDADVFAGGLAGSIQNAYINNFYFDMTSTTVLANSLGEVSGSAVSGGLAGSFSVNTNTTEASAPPTTVTVKNITIHLKGDFSIVSVIDNTASNMVAEMHPDDFHNYGAAVAGGCIGTLFRDPNVSGDINIYLANVSVKLHDDYVAEAKEGDRVYIRAQTLDGDSVGMVFAGGLIGYVYTQSTDYFHYLSAGTGTDGIVPHIYDCNLDVSAVQNGIGPAYAGGVFGYNAFRLPDVGSDGKQFIYRLCSRNYNFNVSAVQSASSGKVPNMVYDTTTYDVCAGGYTAQLPYGYSIANRTYILGKCNIRAYREVGSTAVGSIAAGGYTGMIAGKTTRIGSEDTSTLNGTLQNITILFESDSSIEAGGYSFDSHYKFNNSASDMADRGYGNNVYAGGFAGLAIGYEMLDGISVDYSQNAAGLAHEKDTPLVYAVQDAVSGNADLKSEGFVGGIFGLMIDCKAKDLEFTGNEDYKALIYFESSNNPNTASVGGGVGAVWAWWLNNTRLIDGMKIKNAHVVGKAYSATQSNDQYDIYVGGGIGIMGNGSSGKNNHNNEAGGILVDNCVVDSIGEDQMLTYAAGIVGGIWWRHGQTISKCVVHNSSVTASSISSKAYAAGIAGIVQTQYVYSNSVSGASDCLVLDTEISAISQKNETSAAGIFSWTKGTFSVTNCYSNATIRSSGANATKSYFAGIGHPAWDGPASSTIKNNYFVSKNAGTDTVYLNASRYTASTGAPLYLISYGVNEYTLSGIGQTVNVYPKISKSDSQLELRSSDTSVAVVETNDDGTYRVRGISDGVSYIGVYLVVGGNEYLLCVYPITVENVTNADQFELILKNRAGEALTEANTDAYLKEYTPSGSSDAHYTYIKRRVGNPETSKYVQILPDGHDFFPVRIKLYEVTPKGDWSTDDLPARVDAILAAKGASVPTSAFNGRLSFITDTENGNDVSYRISAWDTLSAPVIVIAEFTVGDTTHGVIVEYVPNYIRSISISPSEMTPSLGIYTDPDSGKMYYIYAPGDTVRFETTVNRDFPLQSSYIMETSFSGTNVKPNGSLVISDTQTEYEITCTVIGQPNITAKAYIKVEPAISHAFRASGAEVSSGRKMAANTAFSFEISPQIGYGLVPTLEFTIGGEAAETVWDGGDTLTLTWNGTMYSVNIEENLNSEYSYIVTLPAELTAAISDAGADILITVSYYKTYYIVFNPNYDGGEVYSVAVPVGTSLSTIAGTALDNWKASLNRYGYVLQDFYRVSHAESLKDYGSSFSDMSAASYTVCGSMWFYVRWTYSVTAETPADVTLSSGFSAELRQEGLVPIDTAHGFGFVISTPAGWDGTPEFDVFVREKDGSAKKITDYFHEDTAEDGYFADANTLAGFTVNSGCLQVVVYPDSLRFYIGDITEFTGDSLYTDSVYGLEYSVNYRSGEALADARFVFGHALPSGTALRLYYQKNGTTVWSGGALTTGDMAAVTLSAFASMKDGTPLTDTARAGAVSERFILIVTPPNHQNSYGFTAATASGAKMAARQSFTPTTYTYGQAVSSALSLGDSVIAPAEKDFTLYPAPVYTASLSGSTLTFAIDGETEDGVTDYRHHDSRYVWRVEMTAGGAIAADATFPALGEVIVSTTTAHYILANTGSFDVSALAGKGYTVSLVEVRNTKQPAEGLTLASFAIQ